MKSVTKKKIKKKILQNERVLVFKNNNLISANCSLSNIEKRIILWLISQIRPDDEKFKKYSIKASEFCEIIGISEDNILSTPTLDNHKHKSMYKAVQTLMSKTITIHQLEEESITFVNWISYASYYLDQARIELSFNPIIKELLNK